jgi:hypothetical protein
MFGDHFYHAILRKSVAVFGTLFNDISVVRRDSNNIVKDSQKVPLSYGPKQKFLARLDQQANLDDPKIALKLPRMSFEISNMAYDTTTKTSSLNTITTASSPTTRSTVGQVTPYTVDMQLNIIAKNQDDALQILEQIVPYFHPTYTLSVKFIDDITKSFDVPITLNAISISDDYEGEFTSRRSLIYTLDFSMKVKFFGPQADQGIVTKVSTDINNLESFGFIEEIVVESTFSVVQAKANAVLVGDLITRYEFRDRGRGYATAPIVSIQPPTSSPTTAVISTVVNNGEVTVNITNPGVYYKVKPDVVISGLRTVSGVTEEFSTTLSAEIQYGKITSVPTSSLTDVITVTSATVAPPTGTALEFTAAATAVIDGGRVVELVPTSFGAGYTTAPTVTIDLPSGQGATYTVVEGVDDTDDNQIT